MEQSKRKDQLVLIGAKVPKDLKQKIEHRAVSEERTLSQTISRLLSTHPLLQKEKEPETALAS